MAAPAAHERDTSADVDLEAQSTPASPSRRARFDMPTFTELDGGNSTRSNSPEPVHTPTISQTYNGLRKNLSFASLKALEVKEVQKAVWRKGGRGDPGERIPRPKDLEQLLVYAAKGGARSFSLGLALRAGVNLMVVMLKVTKRGIPPSLVLNALFGPDTLRFGAMLGIFTTVYKAMLHGLRIFNLGPKGPGQEEWWHAAVAGAASGLAVIAEKPSRRVTIGQQLLVRGLQGQYNTLKKHGYVNIPNGDVLLFGAACGQIMYSWLMAPEALPSGYRRWITNASKVSPPCLPVNLERSRIGTFDPAIARKGIAVATLKNKGVIEAYAKAAEGGDFGPPFAPCSVVHPWVDTCTWTAVDRWQSVFRWMLPVYGALHVIPPILLRHKVFLKDPKKALTKSLLGTMRSCGFLATFVTLFQGLVCSQRNIYYAINGWAPEWVVQLLLHKGYYWVSGFATCLSLFIEEKKRRKELAMYVLPRSLESLWSVLRRRSYVPFVPFGEVLMTGFGMSMVMSTYQHEPKMLSGLVRSVLFQVLGQ